MNKQEKQFKKEYLEEKLHLIGDRLNDAYGQPLLEELINRMEKTVSHFNEEVDSILESIKSRTQNQHYKLASLRGEDPIKEAFEEDNKKLDVDAKSTTDTEDKSEEPKKGRFTFLKRKKKKK
tara:strand:- start:351 stop:716 length:366 start_codon:yes stop_codon:yes gene_type:complete